MLKPSFSWSLLDTLAYSTAWVARTAARSLLASSDDRVLAGIAFPHYRVWRRSALGCWLLDPRNRREQSTSAIPLCRVSHLINMALPPPRCLRFSAPFAKNSSEFQQSGPGPLPFFVAEVMAHSGRHCHAGSLLPVRWQILFAKC